MAIWPVYGRISGPVVLVGFGSIGRGVLPLLLRHFECDRARVTIIDPDNSYRAYAEREGLTFVNQAVTEANYRDLLLPMLSQGSGQAFLVNLSVDVSSVAMMELARTANTLYIDTVIEPWLGHYTNQKLSVAERSNYALRESVLAFRRKNPGGVTAVSCCGANPGMVSWFVKHALTDIARDLGLAFDKPKTREAWAALMQRVGVKGIHIAERDTQRAKSPKPLDMFLNTWSVEGFVSEGLQPAELGWGTHEPALPAEGRTHDFGSKAAIYLLRPGANTRVRSWCPTPGPQLGFLITHNEAISISDYFTVSEGGVARYRPTCHYAYHPSNDAVLSLHEFFGNGGRLQSRWHILNEDEVIDGHDELGVLLYGHGKNAYWYGSQLSIEETRKLAPNQNATGLQVTSAVLAGMVWALENPNAGIVEADEMDHERCLAIQRPYLGLMKGVYTDWTPLRDRVGLFPEPINTDEPWAFVNVLVN